MEKISVIIPIYKVEKYLDRCIKSVINQSYENLEIILVDDGSPDRCAQICDDYSREDYRIKVIHKKNGGLSDARNAGLDIAIGEYISFVDSDDYINKYYIETLYNGIKKNKSQISICEYARVNEIENDDKVFKNEITVINKMDAWSNLYNYEKRVTFVIACGKLFEKSLFDSIRFPIGKINEDSFILYKLYFEADRIVYNKAKLYYYCSRDNSIMNNDFSMKKLDDLQALEEQIYFFRDYKYFNMEKKAIKFYCERLGAYYEKAKEKNNYDACHLIKSKYKDIILNLDKEYYSKEDIDFLKQPWFYPKLTELYWLFIALRNKIK